MSVAVGGPAVLETGFPVVAGFAQRLPIALIPEQLQVTPVGLYMVNHRRSNVSSVPLALSAQRMPMKKSL